MTSSQKIEMNVFHSIVITLTQLTYSLLNENRFRCTPTNLLLHLSLTNAKQREA